MMDIDLMCELLPLNNLSSFWGVKIRLGHQEGISPKMKALLHLARPKRGTHVSAYSVPPGRNDSQYKHGTWQQ